MGNTRESPLNENEINARYVFDMIYDPAETRLMKMAKERGAEVIPGIEMFVHQAARQFEIWTGKPAPWDDMLRVVTLALNERTAARQAAKSAQQPVAPASRRLSGGRLALRLLKSSIFRRKDPNHWRAIARPSSRRTRTPALRKPKKAGPQPGAGTVLLFG